MSLKEQIFNYIRRNRPARNVVMPRWDRPCRIAILHDGGDVSALVRQLTADSTPATRKQVDVFAVPDKKQVCALLSRPKKEVLRAITAQEYDLLIDLTQQPTLVSLYMALYIRAAFKVGRYTRDGIYDLTINTPAQDTPDYLFTQIIKYLHIFTTPSGQV